MFSLFHAWPSQKDIPIIIHACLRAKGWKGCDQRKSNKRISANKTSMHQRTSKDRFWPFYLLVEPCLEQENTSKFVCWFSWFSPAFLWAEPRRKIREQYFFVCLSRRSSNNRILIILTFSVFVFSERRKTNIKIAGSVFTGLRNGQVSEWRQWLWSKFVEETIFVRKFKIIRRETLERFPGCTCNLMNNFVQKSLISFESSLKVQMFRKFCWTFTSLRS